jgi:AraC-like DNA-binding protein
VGLTDASHFTRMFREQTGLTPSGYRIAVREKAFAPHPPPD